MKDAQLTITIKRGRPQLHKQASELANDNLDREQELFERAALRECTREDLDF